MNRASHAKSHILCGFNMICVCEVASWWLTKIYLHRSPLYECPMRGDLVNAPFSTTLYSMPLARHCGVGAHCTPMGAIPGRMLQHLCPNCHSKGWFRYIEAPSPFCWHSLYRNDSPKACPNSWYFKRIFLSNSLSYANVFRLNRSSL